jgi:ATP-dependent DNA helicase RecQ
MAIDLKYIKQYFPLFLTSNKPLIDTLYLSPLLFPKKPYHKLVKNYQLESETKNNPLADSEILKILFIDCVSAFSELPEAIKEIYYLLLNKLEEFQGFFKILEYQKLYTTPIEKLIRSNFQNLLCAEKDIHKLAKNYPEELAYCLALIRENDVESILPYWLISKFPRISEVLKELRYTNCLNAACNYCQDHLDPIKALRIFFGYEAFKKFDGDEGISIQEKVVRSTLAGDSVLAVFPTGGGKSITYQLPALMIAKATRGLTVIISPLQSLMKDQVDVLRNRHGIVNAVTINGLLTPLERMDAIQKVEDGRASLLYISPEILAPG